MTCSSKVASRVGAKRRDVRGPKPLLNTNLTQPFNICSPKPFKEKKKMKELLAHLKLSKRPGKQQKGEMCLPTHVLPSLKNLCFREASHILPQPPNTAYLLIISQALSQPQCNTIEKMFNLELVGKPEF